MKRLFYGLLAVVAAVTFSSCEKSYYEEIIQEVHPTVVTITVPKSAWNYSYTNHNNYFYATVDMPELTQQVLDGGLVKMYRYVDTNVQMEMPFSRHYEYQCDDGSWAFYTETVDYEMSTGTMSIFYTVSDFDYELDESFVPAEMKFRCVIYE